ncbi:hypothetical protein [Ruegeria sp. PrR005]|uniref:Uncharacterized protein n=1 Tax=Ruegeria sp. PrR005 TaxID=2706882 RepID=A0A6B2NQV6_9RHOB|nr:hypothetical protein [Ruegeria sp. PrR005]NDW46546.1 hypothetical protein [Ruegeria sp. PrR005]
MAPTLRKFLIVGTSHVGAIRRAASTLEKQGKELAKIACLHLREKRYEDCFGDDNDEFTGALAEDIARHVEDGFELVSCIGGNAYNILGLVESEQPFDFIYETNSSSPQRELIPLSIVRTAILRRDRRYLQWIAALAKFGPVHHIFSPPPVRSSEYILEHAEDVFQRFGVYELGVTPANIRLKLWRLQCEIQTEFLSGSGVTCITPPDRVRDGDGFLLEDFAARDASHGNTKYGKHVISYCASI